MKYEKYEPKRFIKEVARYLLTTDDHNLFFVKIDKGNLQIADFRDKAEVSMDAKTNAKSEEWRKALKEVREDPDLIHPTPIKHTVTIKWREKYQVSNTAHSKGLNSIQLASKETYKWTEAYNKVQELLESQLNKG